MGGWVYSRDFAPPRRLPVRVYMDAVTAGVVVVVLVLAVRVGLYMAQSSLRRPRISRALGSVTPVPTLRHPPPQRSYDHRAGCARAQVRTHL